MAKKKPTPALEPEPEVEEAYSVFTPAQVEEWKKKAREWMESPEQMEPVIRENLLVHFQAVAQLAMNPPPGRSGPMIVLQAQQQYRDLAEVLDEMLEKRKRSTGSGSKK